MAIIKDKFGLVKAWPEATYGTHPARGIDAGFTTLHDGDAAYVEEFKASQQYDSIQQTGKTLERPGWAPMTGLKTPKFSGKALLRFAQLGDHTMDRTTWEVSDGGGNDATTGAALSMGFAADTHPLPGGSEWLLALGFVIHDSVARVASTTDGVLVFKPDVFGAPSLTVENMNRRHQAGAQAYQRQTMTGCRADGKIMCETGQLLTVELDGGAKTHTRDDYDPEDGGGLPRDLNPDYRDHGRAWDGMAFGDDRAFRQPAHGLNAVSTIWAGGAVPVQYAGGGLHSFEINMNNGLTYPRVMDADGSVSEVTLSPTDAMSWSCKQQVDDVANWDIDTIIDEKIPVYWDLVFTDRETGTDRIEVHAVVYVESVEGEEVDGRMVWNLAGKVAYAVQGQPFDSASYAVAATHPDAVQDLSNYEGLLQIRYVTPA